MGERLAQADEVLVILKHLRIAQLVLPVKLVDAVGRLIRVVNAFLIAQQLLATEHEGYSLRGKHGRLCQQVEAYQFVLSNAWNTGFQPINETHVVVARYIGHHLSRFNSPRCLGVVNLRHVHLRMTDAAYNTELQTLFHVRCTT